MGLCKGYIYLFFFYINSYYICIYIYIYILFLFKGYIGLGGGMGLRVPSSQDIRPSPGVPLLLLRQHIGKAFPLDSAARHRV